MIFSDDNELVNELANQAQASPSEVNKILSSLGIQANINTIDPNHSGEYYRSLRVLFDKTKLYGHFIKFFKSK
jgi:DNA-binding PucR family transcriptional regulator